MRRFLEGDDIRFTWSVYLNTNAHMNVEGKIVMFTFLHVLVNDKGERFLVG